MAQLPIFQDPNQNLMLMQTKWKAIADPILGNPILSGRQINGIALIAGSTSVNHGLNRLQQGWFTVDATVKPSGAIPVFYRSYQVPFNNTTLNLSSNGPGLINIWVY